MELAFLDSAAPLQSLNRAAESFAFFYVHIPVTALSHSSHSFLTRSAEQTPVDPRTVLQYVEEVLVAVGASPPPARDQVGTCLAVVGESGN